MVNGIVYMPIPMSKHVLKAARTALRLFDDRWTGGQAQRILDVEYAEVNVS